MKNKINGSTIFVIIIMVFILSIFAIFLFNRLSRISYVEIRDYQGQKLSSINDFRENSINGPQHVNMTNYNLEVTGLVSNSKNYTYDEVLDHAHYEKVITLYCVEGWDVTLLWEGIILKDLFNETGIGGGANTVIFYSYDGYSTSLPLDYVINNSIMLAYKMNGVVLPDERGYPFQVVAESKLGYKWAKWLTKIELSNDISYKGYWESRGYSNSADVD